MPETNPIYREKSKPALVDRSPSLRKGKTIMIATSKKLALKMVLRFLHTKLFRGPQRYRTKDAIGKIQRKREKKDLSLVAKVARRQP